MFQSLGEVMAGPRPARAPLVLNPLMARLAEKAGFKALYLGGGALGYAKLFLEANINLTEMAQAGVDIASGSTLPMILDAACGWGDPMHMRRTIAMAEAAGFAAIEIEDQYFPKRASHHVGEDQMVPQMLMAEKVEQAVAARRDPEFMVIARTVAFGSEGGAEEALRRGEAYRRAGADLVMPAAVTMRDAETMVAIGERLEPPLVYMTPPGGLAEVDFTLDDLGAAGYKLVVDSISIEILVYELLRSAYREMAASGFELARPAGAPSWWELIDGMHETIDLDVLLEIERRAGD